MGNLCNWWFTFEVCESQSQPQFAEWKRSEKVGWLSGILVGGHIIIMGTESRSGMKHDAQPMAAKLWPRTCRERLLV